MEGLKGSTILVTGGTGFIGGHLVESLLEEGADVIAADVHVDQQSYFFTQNLHRDAHFEFLDIRFPEQIEKIFSSYTFDSIVHLGAQTLVTTAYKNPLYTLETNIMGTAYLLEAVRKRQSIKRIVVASSDKAYGKTVKAYTEDQPLRGDHPYDVSKSCTDLLCSTYYKTYNVPAVVTRFGNVYGEGDLHFDRIIPGICHAVSTGETLAIRSDGTYVRDYLYVKDVVRGYLHLLRADKRVHGEAYNFSSFDKYSVLDLIKLAEKTLGKKVPYKIMNTAKNEIPYQHLQDQKIRKLGWKTQHTMETELASIYTWYDAYLQIYA